MTRDPAQLVGEVIAERYQVVGLLGQGGNGAVCEATDLVTGQRAALKILVGENRDLEARLDREGKALAMLAHPNIVTLIGTGTENGLPYVVTELIHGRSLRELIDAGPVEPRRALAIVRQLLEALNHAHGAGLIHRDIKPDNIMLVDGAEEHVKLIDFGVAKLLEAAELGEAKLTRAGLAVFGTPAYIAPETAIGEVIDARSDLYSVGVVLYELVAGHTPFDHVDPTTLMRMHVTQQVPPLGRDVPGELAELVAQSLVKVPEQRFASAIAMRAAVIEVARSLELPAVGPTPVAPPPTAPPSLGVRLRDRTSAAVAAARRNPRRTAAIGTAACVLLIVILVVALRGGAPSAAPVEPSTVVTARVPKPDPKAEARAFISQGDAELARRFHFRALTAYDRALAIDRSLARDAKIRTAIAQIADGGDAVTAVIALELMATRLEPADTRAIATQAATARSMEVRRRAFAIAERDGFAGSIDRFASFTLDLKAQASCDDRRETIAKLRELGDRRAIEPLQRAQTQFKCIAKEAADAIAHLESLSSG